MSPSYEDIAVAIETACDVGELDVEVWRDGVAVPEPYAVLARCLDKDGLIDWAGVHASRSTS